MSTEFCPPSLAPFAQGLTTGSGNETRSAYVKNGIKSSLKPGQVNI